MFLFEIKSGNKEKKARKQLSFHKKAFMNAQKHNLTNDLFFSEIKIYWVSYENQKIVNVETNQELDYTSFINNPLSFLLKEN